MATLINGVQTEFLSARDRGLHYGDGCFETLRLVNHVPLLLNGHFERLQRACAVLRIPFQATLLRDELNALISLCPAEGVIKIMVTRGEGGRGYRPPPTTQPTRLLLYYPLPDDLASKAAAGVTVGIGEFRLSHSPVLAGLKHLNRLDQVMASEPWLEPCDETLCLDQTGALIEGTRSNLVMVIEDELVTPALDGCGVAGVMLAELAARFHRDHRQLVTRRVGLDDLRRASEVFLCNSVIGVWPVRKLLENATVLTWPIGPVSRQALSYHDDLLSSAS